VPGTCAEPDMNSGGEAEGGQHGMRTFAEALPAGDMAEDDGVGGGDSPGVRRGMCGVPCLDLSCLPLFLVLVLVVPMHEISACHEFKAAEDHDVRSTLWQATVPGDEGSRHVGGGEDSQGMLVFGNED
jgi:hypothetical protein